MGKFPVINFYRGISYVVGILIFIGGFILAISVANSVNAYGESQFNFGVFLVSGFYAFMVGIGVLVTAEILELLVNVEDHLAQLRYNSDRQAVQTAKSEEQVRRSTSPRAAVRMQPPAEITAHVHVKAGLRISRVRPDAEANSAGQLGAGQTITVYGRNSDGTWLSLSRMGKLWVDAADVDVIAGDIALLPILEPAE